VTLLTAIALYVQSQGQGSYPGCVAWMQDPSRGIGEKARDLLHHANPHVAAGGRTLQDYSERMRLGIWGRALESLTVFMDPVVGGNTDHSAVDLRDLQHGLKPVSLYLNVDFADVRRLGPLIGLVVESLVALTGGPQVTAPRHRVLMVLDELSNLGQLRELESSVSHLQGSGAQLHYRPSAGDLATAGYVSTVVGQTTALGVSVQQSMGVSRGWGRTSTTASTSAGVSATGRPLLLPDEVLRLPDDAALVFLEGVPPIAGQKLGLPPVPRVLQLSQWAIQHREQVAGLAVAALLILALWPLWLPAVGQPRTTMAQGTSPAGPTVADASVPGAPAPLPGYKPFATGPGAQEARAQIPQGAWVLLVSDTQWQLPETQVARYGSLETCMGALERRVTPMLSGYTFRPGFELTKDERRWHITFTGYLNATQAVDHWCREATAQDR